MSRHNQSPAGGHSGDSYPKSREEFAAARGLIPGGVTAARRPTSFSDVAEWPIYTERVDGCHVWDVDGNRFIDYLCAFGPIVLGYRNRRVNEAAIREIRRGFIANLSFTIQNRLAERLIDLLPSAERVLFTKTGSDACTLAVRLARGYTRPRPGGALGLPRLARLVPGPQGRRRSAGPAQGPLPGRGRGS